MRSRKPLSLSRKLILGMILFAVVGLIVAFFFVSTLVRDIVYDSILESTIRDRMNQAQQVDAWFQEANHIVENLAEALPLVDRVYYQDIVTHFLNRYDFVQSVWIALEDGSFYDSAFWVPPYWFVSQQRPWWLASEPRSGEVAITLPYLSVETDEIITTLARHVRDWGGQEGVIALNIEILQLEAMMNDFQMGVEGRLLLIGPGGEVIFHPNRDYLPSREGLQNISDIPGYEEVFARFEAGASIVDYVCQDGVASYFIQFPLPSTGWTFVSIIPTTVASVPVWQILSAVIFTIVIVLAVVTVFLFVFIFRSVSQEKNAEKRARDAAELAQKLFDLSPAFIEVWDEDFNFINCNQKAAEIFGLSEPEELIMRYAEFSPEYQPCGKSSDEKWVEMAQKALEDGSVQFEWMHLTASGESLPVETTFLRLNSGGKNLLMGYSYDLREIRAAAEREREASELAQTFMDASPMCIELRDAEPNLVYCNQQVLDILGVSSREEYSQRFGELSPEYQPCGTLSSEKFDILIDKALTEGYVKFEWLHLNSKGEPLPMDVTLVCIMRQDKQMLVSYSHDLRSVKASMERERKLEMKLREQKMNERIQLIMDFGPSCITWYNASRSMIGCNEEAVRLFELGDKESVVKEFNERFYDFFPTYQPCGTATEVKVGMIFDEVEKNGRAQFEFAHLTGNGKDLPTDITLVRVDVEDTFIFVVHLRDLRDVKKLEKQKLEAAQESNRAKSRFLARMSHEIRTPISAVLGISEIQLRNHAMPPHTEEAFAKIYDSSKMLLHIVNDILDFSKIESGKMPLISEEYDVASLVSDVAQLHLVYLENKDVSFKMYVDENLPAKLIGDVLRIRQVINNLLTNAFKYTQSGTVTLSLECEMGGEGGQMLLAVFIQDTGMGMSAEQLDSIKDEYVRLYEHEKSFVSGTGLGLPIVQSLAQMMGAQLDIKSELGKGTSAAIHIPQKVSGTQLLGQELAESLQNFEGGVWSGPKEFEFVPEPMPYGKVLVVDDSATNLYVAETMLESFELSIELCESGQEAIDKVEQGNVYDIIFMDHMMPDMDGIEATKILRDMGYYYPIVALTANAIKGQAEMFIENGFSGFISKPIDIKLLNSYLIRFIKKN